jgi:hypothetical protein
MYATDMSFNSTFKHLILFMLVLSRSMAYSQRMDTATSVTNKSGFSLNAHFIYNLYSNKRSNTWILPMGKIPNDNSGDSVHSMTVRYVDTKTFGVNVSYNKAITKKISFSFGAGFVQRKKLLRYDAYVDSNINKPDKLHEMHTFNSLIIPVKMSYFKGRFCFSVGNNIGLYQFNNHVTTYEKGSHRKFRSKTILPYVTHLESVSYELVKKRGIYINLSAEQAYDFYTKYGYKNWFILGGTYLF